MSSTSGHVIIELLILQLSTSINELDKLREELTYFNDAQSMTLRYLRERMQNLCFAIDGEQRREHKYRPHYNVTDETEQRLLGV